VLIVIGLAYELIETAKSDRQVADINSTNIVLSLHVEELRKVNTELAAKLLPRRITMQQMKDFKFLTERITKTPIK